MIFKNLLQRTVFHQVQSKIQICLLAEYFVRKALISHVLLSFLDIEKIFIVFFLFSWTAERSLFLFPGIIVCNLEERKIQNPAQNDIEQD